MFMPWLDKVQGVLQAWYPGTSGGEAIANLLFGRVNPSGHLPISFPKDASQFARQDLVEKDAQGAKTGNATYSEGATVGYKWHDAQKSAAAVPVRLRAFVHAASLIATCRRASRARTWW